MIHVYTLVSDVDGLKHLRCPDCGKEVTFLRPGPEATSSDGFRILRNPAGDIMHGDQGVEHRWARGIAIDGIGVTA